MAVLVVQVRVTASMQGPLLSSPPSMSASVDVSETQTPAGKRLKTSFNEFEDDDQQTPAVPVDELITYMSLRIPPCRDSRVYRMNRPMNIHEVRYISLRGPPETKVNLLH